MKTTITIGTLLCAAVVQGGLWLWWIADQRSIIVDHEKRLVHLESSDEKQGEAFRQIADRLARIEEKVVFLVSMNEGIRDDRDHRRPNNPSDFHDR